MRKICLFIILLVFSFSVSAEKVATFPDLIRPESMVIDNNQIYIVEGTSVFIHSIKDFKLIKKFGKPGEGPEEFNVLAGNVPLNVYVKKDKLLINSFGKVSFYTKGGEFIKELKSKMGLSINYRPVEDKFVSRGIALKDATRYSVVNIFDSNLKKIKEIYRIKDFYQQSGKIRLLKENLNYYSYKGKIFITGGKGFVLDVLDKDGKNLYSITREYKKLKFTDNDKKMFIESFKLNPRIRGQYEALKDRLVFPETFPEILVFFVSDDKIYIMTWKREGERSEFFIYDTKGKFLKTLFLPLHFISAIQPAPLWIKNDKFYQLIENEDEEEWELHITEIK